MRTLLLSTLLVASAALTALPAMSQSAPAKSEGAPLAEVTAEGVYAVPFASEGNVLELAVVNTAAIAAEAVQVTVAEAPAWLVVESAEVVLGGLAAGEEHAAAFTFSIIQAAPVGEVGTLRFEITAKGASLGEKEIRLQVEAPREIALHSNYPNPFNPTTTIGYTLSAASRVSLRVYDVLGREVTRLVEDERSAGHHEAVWAAGGFASGLYLYRLVVEDEAPGRTVRQRTMLLLK